MAKDTEKLIRQLSLISYLMAERRPVTALDIKRDVEGYSGMNEDAFARRFYADRAELESLRIPLTVEKPLDGVAEQENYSLRPENFHLPGDRVHRRRARGARDRAVAARRRVRLRRAAAPRAAADHLGPAEPAAGAGPARRRARASPPRRAATSSRSASRRSRRRSSATRRSPSTTTRWSATSSGRARSTPTTCSSAAASSTCSATPTSASALRVFRLSRIRGKVAYATKAEHDFRRPADFDPRAYANLADWQFGEVAGTAEIRIAERIAWQLERHFGRYGEIREIEGSGDRLFVTEYSSARQLIAWVLGLGENARSSARPSSLAELEPAGRAADRAPRRSHPRGSRARRRPPPPQTRTSQRRRPPRARARGGDPPGALRAPRHARVDPDPGRARGPRLLDARMSARACRSPTPSCARTSACSTSSTSAAAPTSSTPRSTTTGTIEVDPEPYSDNFARPARLLPVEAKALVAAIDLIGEHLPQGSLTSARTKIVDALGEDPMEQGLQVAHAGADDSDISRVVSKAIRKHVLLELDYYKENEDEYSVRRVEPYALINGREGWYVASFDPAQGRRPPLPPRPDPPRRADERALRAAAGGQPVRRRRRLAAHRRGQPLRAPRASGSPPSARAGRASSARSSSEWDDGAIAVELSFAGGDLAGARGAQGGGRRGRA